MRGVPVLAYQPGAGGLFALPAPDFEVGVLASTWWVEGGIITNQGSGLCAFNTTLRYHTMPVGEGLGPGEYKAITLNKPSPTAGLANLVCSTLEMNWGRCGTAPY